MGWGNSLPTYLIEKWKRFFGLSIESRQSFFILVAAELTISFLFSEVFEYMNTRAEGRWYVIKPWQWGIDFTNWIYYLSYGIFTYSVLQINYLKCWFYPIAAIICVLLLFGVAMLLPWNRKSINYLISCEMTIMTANMFDHKLIYLSMYGCVLLLLYLTEQLQIWIKRFIDKTIAQEQREYVNSIIRYSLSGYGAIGMIILFIITLLKHGL